MVSFRLLSDAKKFYANNDSAGAEKAIGTALDHLNRAAAEGLLSFKTEAEKGKRSNEIAGTRRTLANLRRKLQIEIAGRASAVVVVSHAKCHQSVGCWRVSRVDEFPELSMCAGLVGDTNQPPRTSTAPTLLVRERRHSHWPPNRRRRRLAEVGTPIVVSLLAVDAGLARHDVVGRIHNAVLVVVRRERSHELVRITRRYC